MPYRRVLLAALVIQSVAVPQESPKAPGTHTRQTCRLIKADVLVPANWGLIEEDKGSVVLISITKNGKPAEFHNFGMGILMMKNAPSKLGVPLSKFIKDTKEKTAATGNVLSINEMNRGPFRCLRIEFTRSVEKAKLLHFMSLIIANEKTGTMYSAVATSSDSEWKRDWDLMAPILDVFEPNEAE